MAGRPSGRALDSAVPRTVKLGGGREVPYPTPTSEAATAVAKANRRRDTKPEVRLRSSLHRRGLRFRKDHLVRAGSTLVRPDVVFTRRRLVVFVDGCFWHGCPVHRRLPKTNRDYWLPKLARNEERDHEVDAALVADGWDVIRVWEHEDADEAADRIAVAMDRRPGR